MVTMNLWAQLLEQLMDELTFVAGLMTSTEWVVTGSLVILCGVAYLYS
jgi:hypothetical protein